MKKDYRMDIEVRKITWNTFIEDCKNRNISFLGSINKDLDFVKKAIDSEIDKIEIDYNRCLHMMGLKQMLGLKQMQILINQNLKKI